MYLPDLNNTPLSEALKNGIKWGTEAEVIVECPKLKHYYGVDTLLVQEESGRVQLYTTDEIETFPVCCAPTKFSLSSLAKVCEGAPNQRGTLTSLPGDNWSTRLMKHLSRFDLDQRLDMQNYVVCMQEIQSLSNMHTWSTEAKITMMWPSTKSEEGKFQKG